MSEGLFNFITQHRQALEEALDGSLPHSLQENVEQLNLALRYAVFPGGKRMRPILTLLGGMVVGAEARQLMPVACAIEFLHTSSLILDDLPGMDDADLRRGRAALHIIFGEGIAMLTALALLNQAYALLARAAGDNGSMERLISETTRCIGVNGMIGGQAADLEAPAETNNGDMLTTRNLKTAALMRLTVTAGALACNAEDGDVAALAQYGESLGNAYQICDDLMDEMGDTRHLRSTFITEFGKERARRLALNLVGQAKAAVNDRFKNRDETRLLSDAADYVIRSSGWPEPILTTEDF